MLLSSVANSTVRKYSPAPITKAMKPQLHQQVALFEDIERNGEGLDPQVLSEAVLVEDAEFCEALTGPEMIQNLMEMLK